MMCYFVSSMGTVGHDRMTPEQIVDNILAAASTIEERVPGGPDNIRSILIKCTDSLSIPLHTNIGKYSGDFLPLSMPHSQSKIATFFPNTMSVFEVKKKSKKKNIYFFYIF